MPCLLHLSICTKLSILVLESPQKANDSSVTEHYPPHSDSSLKQLLKAILEANVIDTHKAALLLYLRRDVRLEPEKFAAETYLPQRYITLIDGLWHLDRLHLKEAIVHLTDPTLIPTFSEEILYTIGKHSPQHPELVLEYYNTTSPVLTTTKTLNVYFSALVNSSVTEAFFFTRRQSDATRKHLFEVLLALVHGSSSGGARAKRGVELVGLPLETEEEEWLEEYLLKGKGKNLFGAKDTVIVRRIATGRSDEIGTLAREAKERKIDGVNWPQLAREMEAGL